MIATLSLSAQEQFGRCAALSGLGVIKEALKELRSEAGGEKLFLELLACEGGCINGPGMSRTVSALRGGDRGRRGNTPRPRYHAAGRERGSRPALLPCSLSRPRSHN